ncbi:MAG: hypothetical protein ABIQ31_20960 [Ferruginibacter sp.]
MDIKLTFDGDEPVQSAVAFKSFVDEHRLSGIESLEVEQEPGKPGDQGIGKFLGSIITSITGSSETVKGLVSVISKFLELFDGRLIMEDGKGGKVVIPGGKKLSADQIESIAINFIK